MNDSTTYSNKLEIIADLWLTYKDEKEFEDFISYNDMGCPMAYALVNNIVLRTEESDFFINETWNLLLAGLGIEDTGFETLEDVLTLAGK